MPIVKGILVNGLEAWYKNVIATVQQKKYSWLQSSKQIDDRYVKYFNEQANFYIFGYVQAPVKKVKYRLTANKIISGVNRIPPPDDAVPPYSLYDDSHCKDREDYKYRTWIKVVACGIVNATVDEFINVSSNKPITGVRGWPNIIVIIPERLLSSTSIDEEPTAMVGIEPEENLSFQYESDLKIFLRNNLNQIEDGLKFESKEYPIEGFGRPDFLCIDKDNNYVAVEVKPGIAKMDIIGQILLYVTGLQRQFPDAKIRGILVAKDFDNRVVAILQQQHPEIKMVRFDVNFTFENIE